MTIPFETIVTIAIAGIGVVNGWILYLFKVLRDERHNEQKRVEEDRERLIRIETRLEGLDSMRSDIKAVDKLADNHETRLRVIEAKLEDIKVRCRELHGQ
jgi:hypothetical protein